MSFAEAPRRPEYSHRLYSLLSIFLMKRTTGPQLAWELYVGIQLATKLKDAEGAVRPFQGFLMHLVSLGASFVDVAA